MKTPSHDLFRLIRSLEKGEKIFFKTYSANKRTVNRSLSYVKLFDSIDKLKTYDEPLLLSRLKKKDFKYHFKKAKSYLTNAILNSLREYHSDTSANAELQRLISHAEILFQKKLTAPAKKTVFKAEALALKYELYDYLAVISTLKAKIFISGGDTADIENYLGRQSSEEEKYAERAKQDIKFRALAAQVILAQYIYSASQAKGERQINNIKSILASPLLSLPVNTLSFSSLKEYYLIHFTCSRLLNKWKQAYTYQKEWINHLESDRTKIIERADIYLVALSNLMATEFNMDRMGAAEKSYKKLKYFYFSLPAKKRTKVLFERFTGVTGNYMGVCIQKNNPEKSLEIWNKMKEHISENKLNPNTFLTICDNLSHSYFMLGNYHDALKWTNKILSTREKNALDLQAVIRIYALVVHYELGNYNLLPYMTRSGKRFLEKNNYFSEFEKTMIRFFERETHKNNNTRQKHTEAFRQLKKQLEVLLKHTKHIQALEHFDYMSWIESKIENRPFIEIVRKKHNLL